jgi:hypothetical protein
MSANIGDDKLGQLLKDAQASGETLRQGQNRAGENQYAHIPGKNSAKKSLADIGLPGAEGRKLAAAIRAHAELVADILLRGIATT